ncbi:PEX12 [Mytilus coruscus]|uniref:Peroxisome assembly protein 12 n=1 Tax=Mytilus coruscus TaxID=42192 RepID=A0A6J8DXZ7_MYTCO|nr:PEX12 [Mytilus coruscus]
MPTPDPPKVSGILVIIILHHYWQCLLQTLQRPSRGKWYTSDNNSLSLLAMPTPDPPELAMSTPDPPGVSGILVIIILHHYWQCLLQTLQRPSRGKWYTSDNNPPSLLAMSTPDPPEVSGILVIIILHHYWQCLLQTLQRPSRGKWYTSDNNPPSLLAMSTPDPPESDVDETLPPYDICPVCLKRRTNDTALSVSGFVFCYPCIYEHIQRYSSCPVTSYPARKEHLIKLYPPGA